MLLFLLLILLPTLIFLLLFFLTFSIGRLRNDFNSVRLTDQNTSAIGYQILHREGQRILVDERCITKPIGNRVFLRIVFDDES